MFILWFTFGSWSSQVGGLLTKPLIKLLLPPPKHSGNIIFSELSSPKSFNIPLLANGQESDPDMGADVPHEDGLRLLWSTPSHTVHHYWRKFDNAVMRPVFGGRGFVPCVPGSPTEAIIQWWETDQVYSESQMPRKTNIYSKCQILKITSVYGVFWAFHWHLCKYT